MNRPTFWLRSDWVNPFNREYNWIDFALIRVSGEYDRRFGNVEFHIALAGFHLGGQWRVADGDLKLQASIRQMMDELEAANPEYKPGGTD